LGSPCTGARSRSSRRISAQKKTPARDSRGFPVFARRNRSRTGTLRTASQPVPSRNGRSSGSRCGTFLASGVGRSLRSRSASGLLGGGPRSRDPRVGTCRSARRGAAGGDAPTADAGLLADHSPHSIADRRIAL
jgi:hypothetical protein